MSPLEQATPTEAEAREIAGSIRAHFDVTRDFELVTLARGAWLLQCPLVDCVTADPSSVVGRNIHDHMPSGPDGARVRSLMNEIQMLLHEHPVNQRRESEGRLPINALWLWGFGVVPTPGSGASDADGRELRTDDAWLLGLWKSLGRPASDVKVDSAWTMQRDALIALSVPPSLDSPTALEMLDRGLLLELRQGIQSGRLIELSLLLGQFEVHLDSCSRWRFWRKPANLEELST